MPRATRRNAWTWLAPPGSGYFSKADTGRPGAFLPSRQRTQFARIEQPHWIDRFAKGELAPIGVEAAAILQLEDVWVVEDAAILFERAHDVVEPLFRAVANKRQRADATATLLLGIFVMHQNFVAEAPLLLGHELRLERIRHHDLEIGPAAIDLQRHQCRMIERRFVDAPQIG